MPNNRIVNYRPRHGSVSGALIQGAEFAYRNRKAINDMTQYVKKRVTGQKRKRPTPSGRTGQQPPTAYAGGNDFTRRKSKFSRTRRPKTNAQKINMNKMMIK
eukprot:333490-Chlamydomonas_euryale.AAC.1